MMTDEEFEPIREKLDAALDQAGMGVGVKIGDALFEALRDRKLLGEGQFSAVGNSDCKDVYPTYKGRFAKRCTNLGGNEFEVGEVTPTALPTSPPS